MNTVEDRFERQSQIVPRDRLSGLGITVIGVGAIGRQVALQLASIGVSRLQLVDFDHVEPSNVTTQGYRSCDLGQPKVDAAKLAIAEIDSAVAVDAVCDRFRRRQRLEPVIFCCVDSIIVRSTIWKSVRGSVSFWCDGRMLGEVARVLTADDWQTGDHYGRTLFNPSDAQRGSCTSRSTIYAASVAAGLMVHQFTRFLRGIPIDADQTINLLSGDWSVAQVGRRLEPVS